MAKQKKEWKDMTKGEKIGVYIVLAIILLLVVSVFSGNKKSDTSKANDTAVVKTEEKQILADKVKEALDNLGEDMKNELASTSPDGYRGEITSVEPAGNGTVKVNISTYFKDSGDGADGGQGIARRIYAMVCLDVPQLNSLYVVSSSGLESKSVYRSQIPACK